MLQPANDPFFEQLKLEIQEGVEEARRGELLDEREVWEAVDGTIARVASRRAQTQGALRRVEDLA
jgi:hypothetical protein